MRGNDTPEIPTFFIYDIETRLPKDHPIRKIKALVDPVLERLSPDFDKIYSTVGRPSIPPEYLLRAMVLQTLFSIRSERLLVEEIEFNLAYRWFVGLPMNEPVWDPTVYTKNRDRLLNSDIAERFFDEILAVIDRSGIASDEHFSVDGTLLEAWASMKSFQRKDAKEEQADRSDDDPGNPTVDFKGEKRCNATHESRTDPDSRLIRKGKGKEARLSYCGNVLIENRHGLVMKAEVLQASGTAEEEAALGMLDRKRKRTKSRKKTITLGADKKYDHRGFVEAARERNVIVHVSQREDRRSAIDGRTTRHPGYVVSQRKRKRIEEVFGWGKTVGMLRKLMYRGLRLVNWVFTFRMAVYNLVRLNNLGVTAG
jgi:transposase